MKEPDKITKKNVIIVALPGFSGLSQYQQMGVLFPQLREWAPSSGHPAVFASEVSAPNG